MGCGCAERREAIKAAWHRFTEKLMRNDVRPAVVELRKRRDAEQIAAEARAASQDMIRRRQDEMLAEARARKRA